MFGEVMLIEKSGNTHQAKRLPLGDTGGRNEAWLRDTLFEHPDILPIQDIDSSFGPLVPLCKELRTEAGPLDIAFINRHGKLTLVECKLWRNPEARRKVVAQVLDYARAISKWSYADLQRQVSAATGQKGNLPFQRVQQHDPGLQEHYFADTVTRAMHSGRFTLIIAGDGIREDITGITNLITGNAASAFNLGLVEIALFDIGNGDLAIQPRVVARTQLIERTFVVAQNEIVAEFQPNAGGLEQSLDDPLEGERNSRQEEYRRWWSPVIDSGFDDPEQEPAVLRWPNNIRVNLPYPGVWLTAYKSTKTLGVFLSGRKGALSDLHNHLNINYGELADKLPEIATEHNDGLGPYLICKKPIAEFSSDEARRLWITNTLNAFVTAFRDRLRQVSR